MGKWKLMIALPQRDLHKWPPDWRDAPWHAYWLLCETAYVLFIFPSLSRLHSKGWRSKGGWEEEWLPSMELRDESRYFILSIGVCKWKCQSSKKTNESDTRDATSLAKLLINCHCLFWAFFPSAWLFFFRRAQLYPHLRFWWWTSRQGNKGIDRGQESMLSSVAYKCGSVKSTFFLLDFYNLVSRASINKRGCGSLQTMLLPLPQITAKKRISFGTFSSIFVPDTLIHKFPNSNKSKGKHCLASINNSNNFRAFLCISDTEWQRRLVYTLRLTIARLAFVLLQMQFLATWWVLRRMKRKHCICTILFWHAAYFLPRVINIFDTSVVGINAKWMSLCCAEGAARLGASTNDLFVSLFSHLTKLTPVPGDRDGFQYHAS